MSMKLKWDLREVFRYLISIPFSLTGMLISWCAILMMKFHTYGIGMYPGLRIPKKYSLQWALDQFWERSLYPVAFWIWLTLILDALLRRYAFRLNQR
ncbi:MAG: hypothetical protein JST04_01545 [Bdellovibrionales bacterium]|nr:hypothetical protein [Bdellovibrionales bacterium]